MSRTSLGKVFLLTRLLVGQRAPVLQLAALPHPIGGRQEKTVKTAVSPYLGD